MRTRLFNPFALSIALLMSLLVTPLAQALEMEPFSKARYDQLQAENALILVDISATWCPTCKRQHEVLNAYKADNPDSGIHVLSVDFDAQKEWVKYFKAPRQSTLIIYSGTKQLWFSVAETRKEKIFNALDSAKAGL